MIAQLRSELAKLHTTRWTRTLLGSMLAVTVLVVCLHVFTLHSAELRQAANQPKVFGWASTLGALFAALAGAMSVTAEFRHGTVRPTLLASPDRARVAAGKAAAAALVGALTGVLAAGLVAALGSIGLAVRDIPVALTGADFAQMIAGCTASAVLWAILGTGIGALLRNQVAAVVGLCVWLLLIETILTSNLPAIGKYAPGASGGAIAGLTPGAGRASLLTPAMGALLLLGFAVLSSAAGLLTFQRRDID